MPPFGPIKRRDFVAVLRGGGFTGPHKGKRHRVMRRGRQTVRVPNEHGGDLSKDLLARVLRDAGIGRDEWEQM